MVIQVFLFIILFVQCMENESYKGLTTEEVNQRIEQKLVNKTNLTVGKSYLKIIMDNLLSFFNILLFIVAGLMIYGGYYSGLLFLGILIPNIIIGLYEDIKARRLMSKLHVLNAPKSTVIRNGVEETIPSEKLVLDDVVVLGANAQISADSILLSGTLGVNESLLTGEPDIIYKKPGDTIYSGSYVVNGKAYVKVDKVGNDSYVQQLQSVAKKFKRSKSEILASLSNLFKVIGGTVIVVAIATIIIYSVQGKFGSADSFKLAIGPISGSMVAMIPTGLYLLTSLALATAVINLSRKNAHVQDFYAVEMLARTDTICVDKTGTITDGTMLVKDIVPVGESSVGHIKGIIFKTLNATGDTNATAVALQNAVMGFHEEPALVSLPFTSENKYSGASFKEGTYLIGAPEFINLNNKQTILRKAEEFTSKGFRVLVLAHSKDKITGKSFEKPCETLAIIVIQDHIKEDAKETFEWFNSNDVTIKVISGDNAITVSEIAKNVSIEHADKYISLEGMSEDEVREAANKYTVFGRVTPEQKAILVEAMQSEGHTVAMTGDGVNDILALKKADCSIAMASGAEASKNVSHIVLMNSNFASLPAVVAEGRRVVNNLQRSSSLFLVKTIFAAFTTILFLLISVFSKNPDITYPFRTNNLYIWETVGLGIPAFFLALEPNTERIKGKFLINVYWKSIPAAIIMILGVNLFFVFAFIAINNGVYTGLTTMESAITIATLFMSLFCLCVLFKVCQPLSKYRVVVFSFFSLVALGCIGCSYLLYLGGKGNIFGINFGELSGVNYFIGACVLFGAVVLYFVVNYILEVIRGEHLHDDDEEDKK